MTSFRLRNSEWVLIGFFAYIAALIPFFRDRPRLGFQPLVILLLVSALLATLAWLESGRYATIISLVRDWVPMALTLGAFREMELFVPMHYNAHYENAWMAWDQVVLQQWGLKRVIESLGPVIPTYLELCYLLVYGVGTFCVIILWIQKRRCAAERVYQVDRFYVVLLVGTLLAYALFPYFPTRPPRIAFPGMDTPATHDVFRRLNLFLLRKATIHSGVFPSAHVSSAFAASWAMFLALPSKKRYGWGLLFYAMSVSLATVYGRYHYAADALAGFLVSLVAGSVALALLQTRSSAKHRHSAGTRTHLVA